MSDDKTFMILHYLPERDFVYEITPTRTKIGFPIAEGKCKCSTFRVGGSCEHHTFSQETKWMGTFYGGKAVSLDVPMESGDIGIYLKDYEGVTGAFLLSPPSKETPITDFIEGIFILTNTPYNTHNQYNLLYYRVTQDQFHF